MLIAKISFYFESAKKTEEKFREKLGFQKHCTHPCHPQNRHQGTMKDPYATFSSWHIDHDVTLQHLEMSIRHLFIVAYRPFVSCEVR